MQNRLRESASERVERRIARALMRLLQHGGSRTDAGVEIDFPLSRQDLAEMTGTTLHTVSRTLSSWEERGLVELGRQHVVVRQPHAVVAIAEDLPSDEESPTAPSLSPDKEGGPSRGWRAAMSTRTDCEDQHHAADHICLHDTVSAVFARPGVMAVFVRYRMA